VLAAATLVGDRRRRLDANNALVVSGASTAPSSTLPNVATRILAETTACSSGQFRTRKGDDRRFRLRQQRDMTPLLGNL
jgi:hypothetical protein